MDSTFNYFKVWRVVKILVHILSDLVSEIEKFPLRPIVLPLLPSTKHWVSQNKSKFRF